MTLVSVIMTVYNGAPHLQESIDSVLAQTLSDFEFIIVDDGSDDCTPQILQQAQRADSRIKLINRGRLGRIPALNVAWRYGSGDYIANLDADDLADPGRLQREVTYLQQHPQVGLLGTYCRGLKQYSEQSILIRAPGTDANLRKALIRRNPFVHSSVMIPRPVMEATGGYNEVLPHTEDYELWVRIACHHKIAILPEVLTTKRIHEDAFFRHRISEWERATTRMKIRWHAWHKLSRRIPELYFVLLDPILRAIYNHFR